MLIVFSDELITVRKKTKQYLCLFHKHNMIDFLEQYCWGSKARTGCLIYLSVMDIHMLNRNNDRNQNNFCMFHHNLCMFEKLGYSIECQDTPYIVHRQAWNASDTMYKTMVRRHHKLYNNDDTKKERITV